MLLYIDTCLKNESRIRKISDVFVKFLCKFYDSFNLTVIDIHELNKKSLFKLFSSISFCTNLY